MQLLLGRGTGWSRRQDSQGSHGIQLMVEPGEREALAGPGLFSGGQARLGSGGAHRP